MFPRAVLTMWGMLPEAEWACDVGDLDYWENHLHAFLGTLSYVFRELIDLSSIESSILLSTAWAIGSGDIFEPSSIRYALGSGGGAHYCSTRGCILHTQFYLGGRGADLASEGESNCLLSPIYLQLSAMYRFKSIVYTQYRCTPAHISIIPAPPNLSLHLYQQILTDHRIEY